MGRCRLSRLWSGGTVRWTLRLLGGLTLFIEHGKWTELQAGGWRLETAVVLCCQYVRSLCCPCCSMHAHTYSLLCCRILSTYRKLVFLWICILEHRQLKELVIFYLVMETWWPHFTYFYQQTVQIVTTPCEPYFSRRSSFLCDGNNECLVRMKKITTLRRRPTDGCALMNWDISGVIWQSTS
jgi:hypothetical protein